MSLEFDPKKFSGTFISPPDVVREKSGKIKAFVFDWDGVFNDGVKNVETGSPFSEVDSMGLNMLRFSHWLKTGNIPKCFIITGANNPTATAFAKREHFDAVFLKYINKVDALGDIENNYQVTPNDMSFVFDDILDLKLASNCQLRFCVGRPGSPLLSEYIEKEGLCDYMSSLSGSEFAVREICELLISLNSNFVQTIEERMNFSPLYAKYLAERNASELAIHSA